MIKEDEIWQIQLSTTFRTKSLSRFQSLLQIWPHLQHICHHMTLTAETETVFEGQVEEEVPVLNALMFYALYTA